MVISSNRLHKVIVISILWIIALAQVIVRRLRIAFGSGTLEPDFANVWHPLAKTVANGTPLYTASAVDIKPPVFQIINISTYIISPDLHATLMLLITGVANAIIAVLLFRIVADEWDESVGIVAAGIFLLALPLVNGTHINVRSMAMAGVLTALVARRPGIRGVGVALAVLISQYAAFVIPLFLWEYINRREWGRAAEFCLVGAVVGTGMLAVVAVAWGIPAAIASVYWSFGIPVVDSASLAVTPPTSYFLSSSSASLGSPVNWAGFIAYRATLLAPLLVLVSVALRTWYWNRTPSSEWVILLGIFLLPLFIRAYASYWLYALPFIAIMAAMGGTVLLRNGRTYTKPFDDDEH